MSEGIPEYTNKLDWFERNKIKTVGLIMILVWVSLLIFFWLKTDELTRDPCSLCSEKQGESVLCTTQSFIPMNRVYYPNGSIYQEEIKVFQDNLIAYQFRDVNITTLINQSIVN